MVAYVRLTDKGKALLANMLAGTEGEAKPTIAPKSRRAKPAPDKQGDSAHSPRPQSARDNYISRYGKDAWTHAVTLASRHRTRATKGYGLTEHFTAMEWLNLCARTEFRCSRCGARDVLVPHHRTALSTHGSNAIGNIKPVCVRCHRLIPIPSEKANVGAEWLAAQEAIHQQCPAIGTLVAPPPWIPYRLGVVEGATPPFLGLGPLWGRRQRANPRRPSVFHNMFVASSDPSLLEASGIYPPVQAVHIPTQVLVRWAGTEEAVSMEISSLSILDASVVKAEALFWLQEQEITAASWKVGEYVRSRYRSRRGAIEKIIPLKVAALMGFTGEAEPPALPHEWVPLVPTMARVCWLKDNGKTKVTEVTFISLARLDEEAAVLVRERLRQH